MIFAAFAAVVVLLSVTYYRDFQVMFQRIKSRIKFLYRIWRTVKTVPRAGDMWTIEGEPNTVLAQDAEGQTLFVGSRGKVVSYSKSEIAALVAKGDTYAGTNDAD
jgi:hypothetical protein